MKPAPTALVRRHDTHRLIPSKYREDAEMQHWAALDPIARFEAYLRARGADEAHFASVREEAESVAADARARTVALGPPPLEAMFAHVYTDPHPVIEEQRAWLQAYEASMADDAPTGGRP